MEIWIRIPGWNDKLVAIEKTWVHFRLMKTDFLFSFSFFIADDLLVGQLCTNPKSNRSLLSCLKVTQCSTSEIGDVPLYMHSSDPSYDNRTIASTLKMQIWIATNKRDVPRVIKTKFPATVIVFGVVSSDGHIMPPHIFEVGLKVNTKVYLDVLKRVVIPWCNLVAGGRPWVWQRNSAPAYKSKETQAWLQKECYDFVSFSHWPHLLPRPEHAILLCLVIRREHHQHDLPQHQSKPSIRRAPGKGMLLVPDPYRGGDWGWKGPHWIDVGSTT